MLAKGYITRMKIRLMNEPVTAPPGEPYPSTEEMFSEIGGLDVSTKRLFEYLREETFSKEDDRYEVRVGLKSSPIYAELARNW